MGVIMKKEIKIHSYSTQTGVIKFNGESVEYDDIPECMAVIDVMLHENNDEKIDYIG